ncbi:hypothetical protein [Myxococcus sp. AB036A]|uniref:hypothetical protein n=1 Tax=Myxococcus sp. AB036A TaxID=2562793 RepID=UPI001147903D|nr:hypothetical protein [Myxococcus sp. AB036A]
MIIALALTALLGLLFLVLLSGEKKAVERVRREGKRYVAVIKDLGAMRSGRGRAWLLLKLETPSGPVGKRLIVPIQGAVTWDFLTTARVTEQPVYVHCLLDPSVEGVVTQYGFVLEEAP